MRVRAFAPLALAAVALIQAGCGGSSGGGGTGTTQQGTTQQSGSVGSTLRVGLAVPVSTLNPAVAWGNVTALGLEGLQQLNPAGKLEPALAEKITRPTPVKFVYNLRPGVKFWDGHPLTSADVVNALKYYAQPKSIWASYYTDVKSVVATNRETVTVTLKKPNAAWPYTVGDPSDSGIFEKAFQQKVGSKMGQPGTLIMGTGPWEFKSLNPSAGAQLVANPHYWGPTKPTFKRISFTFFSSESSMALAFRAGQIDIAPEISEPRAFTSTSGSQLRAIPQCEVEAFYMPTNVPQWANIHVRRAVAYALNAEDIVKAKGVPAQIISSMILPSQLALLGSSSQAQQLVSSAPSYKYDLTKAKQEMAESPYPHGFSATFPTNTPYFGTDPQVVASQLQSIGIRMNVIDEPASKWIADAQAGKYAGLTWANCPTYDPSSLILNYFGPDNPVNLSHYNPPEFDRLLDLSTAQYSPSQRLATYGKIMNMLGSQVPMIALFSADYTAAIGPKVSWPTATGNYVERPWALGVTAKG